MLLSLEGATLDYGAVRAVDHLSLVLDAGEICGLVGPNGSGKSSLLNAINGFVWLSGGTVSIDGDDVTKAPSHVLAKRGVARTFQLVRLLKGLTVEENVAAGCFVVADGGQSGSIIDNLSGRRKSQQRVRSRVAAALERAGIADVAKSFVEELPFGTQRRVEIARAIVGEPRLLLLDEPAAGLSEGDLSDLAAIMREEAQRGCAVVLVDHHLHFVVDVCPRLVVMNFGQKLFDGPSNEAIEDQSVRDAYVGT